MTRSIREVADEIGIDFDPEVLAVAEDMERRTASIAADIAEAWGGGATPIERQQAGPDTTNERIAHIAVLNSAAERRLGRAVIPFS